LISFLESVEVIRCIILVGFIIQESFVFLLIVDLPDEAKDNGGDEDAEVDPEPVSQIVVKWLVVTQSSPDLTLVRVVTEEVGETTNDPVGTNNCRAEHNNCSSVFLRVVSDNDSANNSKTDHKPSGPSSNQS